MATLNDFSTIVNSYTPSSTDVPNGIRGGNFWLPNGRLSGINVGDVYTSIINFEQNDGDLTLLTISVPPGTSYVSLASINLPGKATVVNNNGDKFVRLDNPRRVKITPATENINCLFSGRDQYCEDMTVGNDPTTPIEAEDSFESPRCMLDINSLWVNNLGNSNTDIVIYVTDSLELPYYNFGTTSHILSIMCTGGGSFQPFVPFPMYSYPTPGTDGGIISYGCSFLNPTSNPLAPGLTISTGTIRPVIYDFESEIYRAPFSIHQAVFGYGTLPNWIDPAIRDSLLNGAQVLTIPQTNGEYNGLPISYRSNVAIIGGQQYKSGWKGWQG